MLVCIPTADEKGMDALIHDHFGSADFFTLVETDTKEFQVLENRNAHHAHGTCHPMNQLAKHQIDAVICTGMGRRAVEALNSEGIKTMSVTAKIVKDALVELEDGSAEEIDPARSCRGHGQHLEDVPLQREQGRGLGLGRGNGPGSSSRRRSGGRRAAGAGRGRR